jgi:hypothetical protein
MQRAEIEKSPQASLPQHLPGGGAQRPPALPEEPEDHESYDE